MSNLRAYATLAAGAVAISFAPILVKALAADGVSPSAIGFWRGLIGTIVLIPLALLRGTSLFPPRRAFLLAAFAGFVFFLDLAAWHRAIHGVGAGIATILANTQVFLTAILSAVIFRERVGVRFAVAAAVAIAGVSLLAGLGSGLDFPADCVIGLGLALFTAVCYAGFLVSMRAAGMALGGGGTLGLMVWMTAFATVGLGSTAVFETGNFFPATTEGWVFAVVLAVAIHALGWWAISSSLPKLPGAIGALVLLVQPVLATVWGALIYDERLAPLQLLGAGLTLTAIYMGASRGAAFRARKASG